MYEEFFGLREPAFSLAPDPRFLWASETHEEGLAVLHYGILQRKGFLLLTGEVGSGKTTLLHSALQHMPEGTKTAMLENTAVLGPLDVLKFIAHEFGIEGPLPSKADYILALKQFLLGRLEAGLHTVLIIDEAQNLDEAGLEEVRLLSNIETATQKSLTIVLVGQPELRTTLAAPVLRPLRQRIALEHHIEPIAANEIGAYLRNRIDVAGGRYEDVFAAGVEPIFGAFSLGCPRLLNVLADQSLLSAFAKQVRPVSREIVDRKAMSLEMPRGWDDQSGLDP